MNLRCDASSLRFRLTSDEAAELNRSHQLDSAIAGAVFSPTRFGLSLHAERSQPELVDKDNCLCLMLPLNDWKSFVSKGVSKSGLTYSIKTRYGQIVAVSVEVDIRKTLVQGAPA